jgi:hypothetical protein
MEGMGEVSYICQLESNTFCVSTVFVSAFAGKRQDVKTCFMLSSLGSDLQKAGGRWASMAGINSFNGGA